MLLDVRGLVSGYGRVTILHGVDLTVSAGEIVVVLGPNGAGKSTLMKTIAGPPDPLGGLRRSRRSRHYGPSRSGCGRPRRRLRATGAQRVPGTVSA